MDTTFKQPLVNGKDFANRITNASEQLKAVLDPDQVEALTDLAETARDASPVNMAASKVTQGQRSQSYLMNKIAFTAFSGAAGAALGHAGSPSIAALIIGGAAGTAMVVP